MSESGEYILRTRSEEIDRLGEQHEVWAESCKICDDERQYVGWEGQRWTTLEELRGERRNELTLMKPGLTRSGFARYYFVSKST